MNAPMRTAGALAGLLLVGACGDAGLTDPVDPVTVETAALAEAIEGTPYHQELSAQGGRGEYTWTLVSGTPPAGVSLAGNGILGGTPVVPGTGSFQVRATDSDGRTATAELSLTVTPRLAVHTFQLPEADVGVAYTAQLVAAGGRPARSWARTGGSAGAWLTVSTDGVIAGTPDVAGSHTVAVAVVDASGQEATRELTVVVRDPLGIVTTTLPDAIQWQAYGVQLQARGGDGDYAWSLDGGSLPAGLTLSAAGAITGAPEEAGSFSLTVETVDGGDRTATADLVLLVDPAPIIRTTVLPPGTPGAAYTATLTAEGGTGAVTWSVTDGTLPDGIVLSAAGTLSGTPVAIGSSSFTVRAVDEAGAADSRVLTLTVVDDLQPLQSAVPVTGLAGDEGSSRYFFIDVPAGTTTLSVSISGGTGDADLYIRRGALPLDHTYDCRPLRTGNEESCVVTAPTAGSWFVRVRAFSAYAGLTLLATTTP